MSTDGFYRDLPTFVDARGVVEAGNFTPVPEDWIVVLTDVRGSTAAIREGRYKDVNLVGASSITAACNAMKGVELPYVFGGDGATLLVPAHGLPAVRAALLATRQMALREFGLELRVGAVPVRDVREGGFDIRIAKYAITSDVALAMFNGGGLQHAEGLVKGADAARYLFDGVVEEEADLEGLECRWQPLKSMHGEVISVLIKVLDERGTEAPTIYRQLIEEIEAVTGGKELVNPAQASNVRLTLDPGKLAGDYRVHAGPGSAPVRLARRVGHFFIVLYGWLLVTFRLRAHGTDWGRYREQVRTQTDYWKYDDMLRFVIDVSAAQKRALVACFEARRRAGEIAYGLHSASEALMTCLVFTRAANHVHFVDGGGGGYALAAAQLKDQLKTRAA